MNKYQELKYRQQKEMNEFPLGAAFNDEQFKEMMQKWGLTVNDTDKILSLGCGCYIRKTDREEFHAMRMRLRKELQDAIEADKTGKGFISDMFYYELGNHEYCITGDLEETLDALDLTLEQINAKANLVAGLNDALKRYKKDMYN